jgi:hypothetical protein
MQGGAQVPVGEFELGQVLAVRVSASAGRLLQPNQALGRVAGSVDHLVAGLTRKIAERDRSWVLLANKNIINSKNYLKYSFNNFSYFKLFFLYNYYNFFISKYF